MSFYNIQYIYVESRQVEKEQKGNTLKIRKDRSDKLNDTNKGLKSKAY